MNEVVMVDPAKMRMDFNVRPLRHVLRSFEADYGAKELRQFIESTGVTLAYLEDENHWVSYEYWCNLLAALVERTGNRQIAYKYGLNSVKYLGSWGVMKTLFANARFENVRSIVSPPYLYKAVIAQAARWTKSGTMRFVTMDSNSAILEVRMRTGLLQDKNNCLNIKGQFASVVTYLGLPHADVRDLKCAANGDDVCLYELTWQNMTSVNWWHVSVVCGICVGVCAVVVLDWKAWVTLLACDVFLIGILLAREWSFKSKLDGLSVCNDEQAKALTLQMDVTDELNASLEQQVAERTAELQAKADDFREQADSQKKANEAMQASREKEAIAVRHSAIGAIAAGMAHEINNPLNAIRLSIGVVKNAAGRDVERCRVMCENADRAVSRCAKVIRDLLLYSRDPRRDAPIDVGDVVVKTVEAFKEERESNMHNGRLDLVCNVESNLPKVKIDPVHLQQIIINLLKNAADAVLDHGEIEVGLESRNDRIQLSIRDGGKGMDQNILENLYHPVESKKANGLGMGLVMTYQLVRRNDCLISLDSEKEKGTTFVVTMPVVKGSVGRPMETK